jgi:DNA-binding response OmpR family regulator
VEEVLRVISVEAPAELPVLATTHDPSETTPAKRTRILVVEDDAVCRRFAVRALELAIGEPEVFAVDNGVDALALVEAKPPDLIVLDVMMPEMSGIEVCRRLRQNVKTAFIPILMLTASVSDEHRLQGFVAGTDDYMNKPVSVPELHARVARLLQRTYGQTPAAAAPQNRPF